MIILFLALILIMTTFILFSFSYQINGINHIVTNTPHSIFEASIPLTTPEENIILYFDQETLKNEYENYLARELKKYSSNYEVSYYFFNTSDGGYCDINNCQGVEINLEVEIMLGMHYSRTMEYEITESKFYG